MNPETITEILSELRVLRFFPSDEHAMLALVRLAGSMATSEAQVRWLVSRMTSGIYAEWPGPQEMRACFCSKFKPKDGINAYSTVYLDGIPPERKALPNPSRLALPAGKETEEPMPPANPRMEAAVQIGAETLRLKNANIYGPATKEEIAAAPEWLRKLEGLD